MPDSFLKKLADAQQIYSGFAELSYHSHQRELIYELDQIKLYHYQAKVKKPDAIPLLVVFATVNRPEILDLLPDQSFLGGLLDNGADVYLIDWGYPDSDDNTLSMHDYISHYLHACVLFIKKHSHQKQINVLGICQGGLLCLCYTLMYKEVKNLILISTPIDFSTRDHVIARVLKQIEIKKIIEQSGNIAGAWLTQFFISLRPFELIGKKYLNFVDQLQNTSFIDSFLRVEKWLHDAPDQAGTAFGELLTLFYQQNKLIKNELMLGGKKIDLAQLNVPILNIMAREDQITPMSASKVLKQYVGSNDYTQAIFDSGHIGIYISKKVLARMPRMIAEWLRERS